MAANTQQMRKKKNVNRKDVTLQIPCIQTAEGLVVAPSHGVPSTTLSARLE